MKRKVIISLIAILILMLSQYKLLLTGYAKFFTIDNPVYGVDAPIVILSGGLVTRIPKALELYEKGYGRYFTKNALIKFRPVHNIMEQRAIVKCSV